MKVSKINIKNFKRFKNLKIDLGNEPKKIIALVGPNGCGKSSVLDAFVAKVSSVRSSNITKGSVPIYFYHNQDDFHQNIFIFDNENQEVIDKFGNISFRSPYRYNSNLDIKEIKAVSPIKENLAEYREYMEENDIKPSEAKSKIIGNLN
ncbi:AAA family ATPase [Neisseria perflava]|uniref:AAA family ATPase n=1 Tax=Neisseria perflava TaxID=33053 RepID=UPI0020A1690F|nr:AAA family ATPase [Neisseria perflava]MCP1661166.1 putative ATP-binding protein involved in virulence [Neisseria perflava]MCP1773257.1 putative ATP-binding protein involved in virulence [Neisseria perflava]